MRIKEEGIHNYLKIQIKEQDKRGNIKKRKKKKNVGCMSGQKNHDNTIGKNEEHAIEKGKN